MSFLSTSPYLGSSPKSNGAFSLYAESSSTRRGSVNSILESSPVLPRKPFDSATEQSKNFVPPKLGSNTSGLNGNSGHSSETHSRQNSFQSGIDQSFNTHFPNRDEESIIDPYSLLKMAPHIVKSRKGGVLTRNTILKMDHFPSGTNTNLDFHLQGAPNFRIAELNVHGVAQPTVIGLSTILSMLNCHPASIKSSSCTWFSTREEPLVYLNGVPYVLRDYADPMQNMSTFYGMNAARLEKLEERLKMDILKEAQSLGGLLLVHQELPDKSVVPCFIATDKIQTPKEVFQEFQNRGYRLKYFRIPISPEQAPEDNYFDEYINVIRNLEPTDPLIFNCGIGAVRTTVGIIIAQIIRRTQLIERGQPDPFPVAGYSYSTMVQESPNLSDDVSASRFAKGFEDADNAIARNNALLRVVLILENALDSKRLNRSATEWMLERGSWVENLKEAVMGNYQSIMSLTTVLESGTFSKKVLDLVIDRSDAVIHLRESILTNRIRQMVQASSEYNDNSYLGKALNGLQRYFFLLCFTAYVNESPNTKFETRFSSWVKARTEIWAMLQNMRRKGPRPYFFRPVEDLHFTSPSAAHNQTFANNALSKRTGHHALTQGMFNMTGAGSQPSLDVTAEMEEFVLNSRTGVVLSSQTILKVDFWHFGYLTDAHDEANEDEARLQQQSTSERHHSFVIDGASNFRRIENTHVYGVAQPTVNGLRQVIRNLLQDRPRNEHILWINLREEPIIYINGIPYVLRDRAFTLRNLRAYKGITGSRMEQLEERLKEDVIREVMQSGGRILLHGEDKNGNVLSSWEEVNIEDIMTVREVMEFAGLEIQQELAQRDSSDEDDHQQQRKAAANEERLLEYHRVPITAEKAPEWRDFDDLTSLVTAVDLSKTAIIMNCQVGLGRSTTGTVIASLLTRWIRPKANNSRRNSLDLAEVPKHRHPSYQIINSLLRVIRRGLENKSVVDSIIEQCAIHGTHLITVIESARIQAEKEKEDDPVQFKRTVKRGITSLERYFMFICFQAYLDSTSPSLVRDTESFGLWMKRHPELGTILQDLLETKDEFSALIPVEQSLGGGDGVALSSEVMRVVNARHGQVLAQQTILKHDAFPGCQKMSLKEKIPGAYNFRRIEIDQVKQAVKEGGLAATVSGLAADMERDDESPLNPPFISGCAMPNKDAIKSILKAMQAGPGGRRWVYWTCLREEPVLYVNKNPYVLRLFIDPLKNLETTGISRERVESMEDRMRLDVIQELDEYDNRMLLHDEDSGFNLLPLWETVQKELVETPRQVFESIRAEGYQVDYLRIPITDEQAPIPDVFDQLIERMNTASQGVDMIFNCQMGRGRTTTGMIVASLLSMILSNDAVSEMNDPLTGFQEENDNSHDERERYQNGEYRVILQLVTVLTFGKLAKRLTDQAINMCDHMQNLRKAIYDYKLRLEAVTDQGSKKWKATREVAINYLVRYFYLIVFANYLLEEMRVANNGNETAFKEAQKLPTFKRWLKGRREIVNIISLHTVDLS